MSDSYVESVHLADGHLNTFMDLLRINGVIDQTTIFVTSDHGGRGTGHGGNTPAEVEIPWIVSGPDIRKNHQIHRIVSIHDTPVTAARLLGLKPRNYRTGYPIQEIFKP